MEGGEIMGELVEFVMGGVSVELGITMFVSMTGSQGELLSLFEDGGGEWLSGLMCVAVLS
ncbi:hypothetical protein A2U01_0031037, partial [Trifolium medium]|nr:hypothetical protein [Trifolium medium]